MPQLNPATFISQIFWLFLVFTFMYLFVSRFFVPRIGKVVEGRKESIHQNINRADRLLQEQKQITSDINHLIDDAKKVGSELKAKTTKETEIFFDTEVSKIEREISTKMVSEEQKLSRFKAKLEGQVKSLSHEIALEVRSILLDSHSSRKN